jgi:DNA-binding transcriptional ArsR family regulator
MSHSFTFPEDADGRRDVRSRIMEHLARYGASKVSDISSAINSSRENVRYHLAALEAASLVRSNISPGTRAGCTPFYALMPATVRSRQPVS